MNVLRTAALVTVSLVLVTACAGSRQIATPLATASAAPVPTAAAAVPTFSPTATPVPPTAPPATATPAPASARVVVTLTDTMAIEPATMTVPAGEPVTFVVTNVGNIQHEFTLGDADVQDEHEQEMMEMGGGMAHDEDNAIAVAPGETKELVYTFEMPGMSLAGCHVPGHYPAGMKATITVKS